MTEVNQQLVDILQRQIEVEEKTLTKLAEAEDSAKETSVRLVFLEMRLDSYKHKKFLEGVIEMLQETPCDKWSAKVDRYIDRVKLQKQLEEFLDDEGEMLELVEQAIPLMNDPIGELLLTHLKEDEQKHNRALLKLVKIVQQIPLQTVKGEKGSDIVCAE
ncbi:MAG: hypothetical protein RTU92_03245 [Candidatus Thorarchaeota archaeon]